MNATDQITIVVKAEHTSNAGGLVLNHDRYCETDDDGEETWSDDVWVLHDTRQGHLAYAETIEREHEHSGAAGQFMRRVALSIREALA